MSRVLATLVFLSVIGSTVVVGGVLLSEADKDFRQHAIQQAQTACNANLPGDNWTVANRSVNMSQLDGAQSLVCMRNGNVRQVNVSIDIEVQSQP